MKSISRITLPVLAISALLLCGCVIRQAKRDRIVISGNYSGGVEKYEEGRASIIVFKGYKREGFKKLEPIAVGHFLTLSPNISYAYYSSSLEGKRSMQLFRIEIGLGKNAENISKRLRHDIEFHWPKHYFQIGDKSYDRNVGNVFVVILDEEWNPEVTQISVVEEKLINTDQVLKLIQKELPDDKSIQTLKSRRVGFPLGIK